MFKLELDLTLKVSNYIVGNQLKKSEHNVVIEKYVKISMLCI